LYVLFACLPVREVRTSGEENGHGVAELFDRGHTREHTFNQTHFSRSGSPWACGAATKSTAAHRPRPLRPSVSLHDYYMPTQNPLSKKPSPPSSHPLCPPPPLADTHPVVSTILSQDSTVDNAISHCVSTDLVGRVCCPGSSRYIRKANLTTPTSYAVCGV
jgi:hypothetical protein